MGKISISKSDYKTRISEDGLYEIYHTETSWDIGGMFEQVKKIGKKKKIIDFKGTLQECAAWIILKEHNSWGCCGCDSGPPQIG